ncbi:MAG: radical SAM protein [Thermodesulfobacteriota bacterium]
MNSGLKSETVNFKRAERNVFFHILTSCNLSCSHCYINREQHGSETLGRQTIVDWLKLFYNPGKETNIVFLGGEPTLHPDLADLIKTANRIGYNSVTVDTNGYLFYDILKKIKPAEAVLSFSLDGPVPEINDPIRGSGSFEICLDNIKRAVAAGFEVSVIYTVSRRNLDSVGEMPEFLNQSGVKRFFIQVIGLRGKSAEEADSLQLTPREWLDLIPRVARDAADKGLRVIYPKVFLDPEEKFECGGLVAENYFVFPNGRVYLCPLCEDYPVNAYRIEGNRLLKNTGLTEDLFFKLDIPEGCVMNKLLQPGNLDYNEEGIPLSRVSCCLLKQQVDPD